MIKELAERDTPPTTLGEFMPPHKIIGKVDDLLYRCLEACLPNLSPFLEELPSRESGPQSCLESPRGAGEVSLEPSEEAAKSTPTWKSQEGQVRKVYWNPQERQYTSGSLGMKPPLLSLYSPLPSQGDKSSVRKTLTRTNPSKSRIG